MDQVRAQSLQLWMPWQRDEHRFQPELELQDSQPDRDKGGSHTEWHPGHREDKIQVRLLPGDLDSTASRCPVLYVYFCARLL